MSNTVPLQHGRLGEIWTDPAEVFEFPGLPGFADARRFVVRQHDAESPFGWLVCLDQVELAFPLAVPWEFVLDYSPHLSPHHLSAVGYREGDELRAVVLAVLGPDKIHLNLAAPLVMNLRTRRGVQAVLDGTDYPVRHTVSAPLSDGPASAQTESNPQR